MSEMVERCAQKLADRQELRELSNALRCPEIEIARDFARIVIAAMREPTEAMVGAGEAKFYEHTPEARDWALTNTREAWQAMIDEALK